ncbi:MAG: hypothetical protein ACI8Q1_002190 [Parvicella sp.]|jgi:hypothetical protein
MIKLLPFLFILSILVSCNSADAEPVKTDKTEITETKVNRDTTSIIIEKETVLQVPFPSELPQLVQDWITFHGITNSAFSSSTVGTFDSLEYTPYNMEQFTDNQKLLQHFFIYSPDSKLYVDLDSYGSDIKMDETEHYYSFGGDVDQKVSIVKPIDWTHHELLQCGTACNGDNALWQENLLWFMYLEEDTDQLLHPCFRIYDFEGKTIHTYTSESPTTKYLGDYTIEVRLKEVYWK